MRRRGFLFAVLLYVVLDMSLPMMPGAFYFEPEYSVDTAESYQTHRGRRGPAEPVLPAFTRVPYWRSDALIDASDQLAPTNEFTVGVRLVTRLPRATLAPAPSPEDPH